MDSNTPEAFVSRAPKYTLRRGVSRHNIDVVKMLLLEAVAFEADELEVVAPGRRSASYIIRILANGLLKREVTIPKSVSVVEDLSSFANSMRGSYGLSAKELLEDLLQTYDVSPQERETLLRHGGRYQLLLLTDAAAGHDEDIELRLKIRPA